MGLPAFYNVYCILLVLLMSRARCVNVSYARFASAILLLEMYRRLISGWVALQVSTDSDCRSF